MISDTLQKGNRRIFGHSAQASLCEAARGCRLPISGPFFSIPFFSKTFFLTFFFWCGLSFFFDFPPPPHLWARRVCMTRSFWEKTTRPPKKNLLKKHFAKKGYCLKCR